MDNKEQLQDITQQLRNQILILGVFVLFIWLIEIVDWILGGNLDQFGILPRQIIGLRGIIFAPVLHGSFGHAAANTIPFLILGWFVLLRGFRTFAIVAVLAIIIGGLGTWLIAPSASVHIGTSGLIFGFLGYLIFRGYFERSWQSIAWSIFVLFLYGSMLLSIFPTTLPVSWQMHLFGFIGGALAAYLISKNKADASPPANPPI